VSSAALCAASFERYVVAPNRAHFHTVDVIAHSWSPEVGAALDILYAPRRSVHEPGIPRDRTFRCPNVSFSWGYCHRTASHLLGIARAMRLKRLEEVARGRRYDAVLLSRWDVLWAQPLLSVRRLPGWQPLPAQRRGNVWLPRICTPVAAGNVGGGFRSAVCGGGSSLWLASQAARECSPPARACQPDMTPEARELYVMDWYAAAVIERYDAARSARLLELRCAAALRAQSIVTVTPTLLQSVYLVSVVVLAGGCSLAPRQTPMSSPRG
jgi:hypothetical protein